MTLPVTAFVGAVCALLLLFTAVLTVRQRLRLKAAFGDHGDAKLIAASRSHGNLAEHAPIVVILLGASLQLQGFGDVPGLSTLRGTGSTLTSYVYTNSPAGEGAAPEKAYAAAVVLLVIAIGLNFLVDMFVRRDPTKAVSAAARR